MAAWDSLPRYLQKTTIAVSATKDKELMYLYLSPQVTVSDQQMQELRTDLQTAYPGVEINIKHGGFGHAKYRLYNDYKGKINAIGISNPKGPCKDRDGCFDFFTNVKWKNIWHPD